MLDHLDHNVSDLERSRAFYEPLLATLGYTPFDAGNGWCSFIDAGRRFYLVLVQAPLEHLHAGFHRKRVGVNHLAFAAPNRSSVDELHTWLQGRGVKILYESPLMMGERYAVFFEDPDRMKLEYVFRAM